jgi:hypothetical protein
MFATEFRAPSPGGLVYVSPGSKTVADMYGRPVARRFAAGDERALSALSRSPLSRVVGAFAVKEDSREIVAFYRDLGAPWATFGRVRAAVKWMGLCVCGPRVRRPAATFGPRRRRPAAGRTGAVRGGGGRARCVCAPTV